MAAELQEYKDLQAVYAQDYKSNDPRVMNAAEHMKALQQAVKALPQQQDLVPFYQVLTLAREAFDTGCSAENPGDADPNDLLNKFIDHLDYAGVQYHHMLMNQKYSAFFLQNTTVCTAVMHLATSLLPTGFLADPPSSPSPFTRLIAKIKGRKTQFDARFNSPQVNADFATLMAYFEPNNLAKLQTQGADLCQEFVDLSELSGTFRATFKKAGDGSGLVHVKQKLTVALRNRNLKSNYTPPKKSAKKKPAAVAPAPTPTAAESKDAQTIVRRSHPSQQAPTRYSEELQSDLDNFRAAYSKRSEEKQIDQVREAVNSTKLTDEDRSLLEKLYSLKTQIDTALLDQQGMARRLCMDHAGAFAIHIYHSIPSLDTRLSEIRNALKPLSRTLLDDERGEDSTVLANAIDRLKTEIDEQMRKNEKNSDYKAAIASYREACHSTPDRLQTLPVETLLQYYDSFSAYYRMFNQRSNSALLKKTAANLAQRHRTIVQNSKEPNQGTKAIAYVCDLVADKFFRNGWDTLGPRQNDGWCKTGLKYIIFALYVIFAPFVFIVLGVIVALFYAIRYVANKLYEKLQSPKDAAYDEETVRLGDKASMLRLSISPGHRLAISLTLLPIAFLASSIAILVKLGPSALLASTLVTIASVIITLGAIAIKRIENRELRAGIASTTLLFLLMTTFLFGGDILRALPPAIGHFVTGSPFAFSGMLVLSFAISSALSFLPNQLRLKDGKEAVHPAGPSYISARFFAVIMLLYLAGTSLAIYLKFAASAEIALASAGIAVSIGFAVTLMSSAITWIALKLWKEAFSQDRGDAYVKTARLGLLLLLGAVGTAIFFGQQPIGRFFAELVQHIGLPALITTLTLSVIGMGTLVYLLAREMPQGGAVAEQQATDRKTAFYLLALFIPVSFFSKFKNLEIAKKYLLTDILPQLAIMTATAVGYFFLIQTLGNPFLALPHYGSWITAVVGMLLVNAASLMGGFMTSSMKSLWKGVFNEHHLWRIVVFITVVPVVVTYLGIQLFRYATTIASGGDYRLFSFFADLLMIVTPTTPAAILSSVLAILASAALCLFAMGWYADNKSSLDKADQAQNVEPASLEEVIIGPAALYDRLEMQHSNADANETKTPSQAGLLAQQRRQTQSQKDGSNDNNKPQAYHDDTNSV